MPEFTKGSHIYYRYDDGGPHIYVDMGTGVPKEKVEYQFVAE